MTESLVIVIEDNDSDIFLIKEVLAQLGIGVAVEYFQYGGEALSRIREVIVGSSYSLRLVLLDLNLPDIDGRDLLRQLKGDETTRWIPVVIVSTSNSCHDLQFCYSNHVNSYIVKPMGFEELKQKLGGAFRYWVEINHL